MELWCCFQLLWLRVLMRKWFNIKIVDDFSSDELSAYDEEEDHKEEEKEGGQDRGEGEACQLQAPKNPDCIWPLPDESLTDWPVVSADNVQQQKESLNTERLRIAVKTWNVAGRVPPKNLDLRDWLDTNDPVDIYVIGFQEIVPLTVGNVCGLDDIRPAMRWQALIRETINRLELDFDRTLMDKEMDRIKTPVALDNYNDQFLEDEAPQKPLLALASNVSCTFSDPCEKQAFYVRVASKQMAGIHISIWVRRKLCRFIQNLSVSCVGLGLMGCLGNKGSISVSMRLHKTSFCFICSHLTAGGKQEDEKRRNWDVMEVLERTHFPVSKNAAKDSLRSIWGHDQIIWLGDLNYRLNLMDDEIRLLVAKEDWTGLFKKDQLRKQSKKGRIFEGWQEGTITFPPTYKYEFESHQYAGKNLKAGEKQRSPAWCDRVLWHGKGIKLLAYKRGESTLSDHRPVIAIFLAEVKVFMLSKAQDINTDNI